MTSKTVKRKLGNDSPIINIEDLVAHGRVWQPSEPRVKDSVNVYSDETRLLLVINAEESN